MTQPLRIDSFILLAIVLSLRSRLYSYFIDITSFYCTAMADPPAPALPLPAETLDLHLDPLDFFALDAGIIAPDATFTGEVKGCDSDMTRI
jgi:hypothetical protein